MKKLLILLLVLIPLGSICKAQGDITIIDRPGGGGTPGKISESGIQWTAMPVYKDNIVPPSPGAAQMTKYVDLPITHSLGLVDITIPLYSIKLKGIEIPISLSYNGSGIKVDENAGAVGLGWTLNAGGVIAREVRGLPDEAPRVYGPRKAEDLYKIDYSTNKEVVSDNAVHYLERVITNMYDSFYDIYRYTYPNGGSGSFILNNSGPVKLISNDDIISKGSDSTPIKKTFTITDPNGNTYLYEQQEFVYAYSQTALKYVNMNSSESFHCPSSWYLSKINNFNYDNNVNYVYETLPGVWKKHKTASALIYINTARQIGAGESRLRDFFNYINEEYFTSYREYSERKILKRIEFTGGVVLFNYNPKEHSGGTLSLKSITVTTSNGDLIKKININQSFFGNGKVKLDSVEIAGSDNKVYDSYKFDYYNTSSMMYYNAQDRFGYHNGKSNNPNLLYKYLFYNDYRINTIDTPSAHNKFGTNDVIVDGGNTGITSPESIMTWKRVYYLEPENKSTLLISPISIGEEIGKRRDYSVSNARTYALQSIERLSGAKTEFIYGRPEKVFTDPDRHFRDTVSTGLRIDSIKTFDRGKLVKTRAFKYRGSGCTIDFNEVYTGDYVNFKAEIGLVWMPQTARWLSSPKEQIISVNENPVLPGADISSAKVFYEQVTETVTGTTPEEKIVTRYTYDCSESIHKRIMIPQIHNTGTQAPGAVQGYGYWRPDGVRDTTAQISHIVYVDSYFKENPPAFNNITNKSVYRTEANGTLKLASEEITSYIKLNNIEKSNISDIDNKDGIFVGLFVQNRKATEQTIHDPDINTEGNIPAPDVMKPSYLTNITSVTDCNFFNIYQGVNTTRPRYTIRKTYNDSGVNTQRILYKYNNNVKYTMWPQQPIISDNGNVIWDDDALLTKNPVPERCSTVNLKERIVNIDGKIYHNRYLFPENYIDVNNDNKNMPFYTQLGEELIINGENVGGTYTQYKKIKTGLRNIQPVEKVNIVNNISIANSKTTHFDAMNNPACIVKTGEPTTCYIWGYNGKYPVAIIRNAEYGTIESVLGLTVIERITLGNSLSTSDLMNLDNLRNSPYFKNAQITTYSYKPFVGITSVTDPSGRKLFYFYNPAGKLVSIKDENMNLIETYEYKNIN